MHVVVVVESIDDLFDLALGRRCREVLVEGANADLRALGDLYLDVARARGVVADEDRPEAGRAADRRESLHSIGQLHLDAGGESLAVE